MSTPADLATCAAQGPAQFTVMPALKAPPEASRLPVTRAPSRVNAVTSSATYATPSEHALFL